ncbi:hypothetical protein IJ818_02230, partial [bacterium]|nr:hypothetical protein [bacterium]
TWVTSGNYGATTNTCCTSKTTSDVCCKALNGSSDYSLSGGECSKPETPEFSIVLVSPTSYDKVNLEVKNSSETSRSSYINLQNSDLSENKLPSGTYKVILSASSSDSGYLTHADTKVTVSGSGCTIGELSAASSDKRTADLTISGNTSSTCSLTMTVGTPIEICEVYLDCTPIWNYQFSDDELCNRPSNAYMCDKCTSEASQYLSCGIIAKGSCSSSDLPSSVKISYSYTGFTNPGSCSQKAGESCSCTACKVHAYTSQTSSSASISLSKAGSQSVTLLDSSCIKATTFVMTGCTWNGSINVGATSNGDGSYKCPYNRTSGGGSTSSCSSYATKLDCENAGCTWSGSAKVGTCSGFDK